MQEKQELDHLFKLVAARVLTTIDMLHEAPPAQSEHDHSAPPASSDQPFEGELPEHQENQDQGIVYAPREWTFYYKLADRLQSLW